MRRFLIVILIVLLAQVHLVAVANADGISDNGSITITLRDVDVSDVLEAPSSTELDDLLYPSVKLLPTRYLDLSMLVTPAVDTIEVSQSVYDLLTVYFPSGDSTYTWAECYAAAIYINWLNLDYIAASPSAEGDTRADVLEFMSLVKRTGIRVDDGLTNIEVVDVGKFVDTFRSYYESLCNIMDIAEAGNSMAGICIDENTKVVLSLGLRGYSVNLAMSRPAGLDMQDQVKWLETRDKYIISTGLDMEISTAAINFSVESQLSSVASDNDSYENASNMSPYVSSFATNFSTAMLPSGVVGAKDITLGIALVLVLVSIIVFIVIDVFRRINDTMRKWRWRWR